MAFWTDYTLEGLQPKRKFTFFLSIGGEAIDGATPLNLETYLIKKVKKPGFEITESEHKFLNHTFYYPGKVKWKEVTFSVVDVISPNTTNRFLKLLNEAGYRLPKVAPDTDTTAQTVSKIKSVRALGIPRIHQIDDMGNVVETWKLHGAWVKSVEMGELDYDGEELMALDVILRYDFAECEFLQTEGDDVSPLPSSNG